MRKIKWGIIGAGGIALKRMIPAMMEMENEVQLLAVYSRNEQTIREMKEKYCIQYGYTHIDDLLNNDEIESVYIATPIATHYEFCRKAAKAGKHILCEKPIALTLSEAEEIKQVCNAHQVKLGVAFMMRFHAIHNKVKSMIEKGELGDIVFARAQLSHYKAEYNPDGSVSWRAQKEVSGGGSLMDMGIHCIDLLRYWLGEVKEIAAMTDTISNEYDVEDTACVMMKHESGAQSIVDACFNISGARNVFEVCGTKGSVFGEGTIDQLPTGRMTMNTAGMVTEYEYTPVNTYCAEIRMINESIIKNQEPFINIDEGIRDLKLVYQSYLSSETGRKIKV